MDDLFDAGVHAAWTQCWQVTLLIVAVWLTVRYVARNRPHLASVLWLVVLIKCVTPPVWSSPSSVFSWLQAQSPSTTSLAAVDSRVNRNDADFSTTDVAVQMPRSAARNLVLQAAPMDAAVRPLSVWRQLAGSATTWNGVLVLTWLFGCLGFASIACLRGVHCWSRLRLAGTADAPEVLQLAARLGRRLGLRRPVKVIVSNSPVGPAVVGILRPVVILPSLIVDAKSLAELEPLLAHELIHIRRGDLWVGLLQLLAQGIWWFHPLVRWSNQWLTRESERCCDEEVIARLGCEPGQYARSLIDVLALKRTLQPIPAFPGVRPVDVTSQRLERIMKLGQGCHKRTPRWCWMIMLLVIGVTLPGAALIVADEKQPAEPVPLPAASIQVTGGTTTASGTEASADPVTAIVYNADDLIRRYREEVRDSEQEAMLAIEHMLQSAINARTTNVQDEADGSPSTSIRIPRTKECELAWHKTQLVIRSRQSLHPVITEELRRLRNDGFAQVQIEVRMISGKFANVDDINVKWQVLNAAASVAEQGPIPPSARPAPAPVPPPEQTKIVERFRRNVEQVIRGEVNSVLEKHRVNRVAIVDSEQATAIIDQAQRDTRTNLIQAPKVVLFSGQNASISDQVWRPFVVAFERENNESKPVIRTLSDGWQMQVRPKVIDARDNLIGLNLNLSLSQIVAVKTARFPGDKLRPDAVVQCPEVDSMKISTTLELKGNQTLVIGDMTRLTAGKDEPFLLLIKVKKVVPEGSSQAKARPEPTPPSGILPVAAAAVADPNVGKTLPAQAQDDAEHEPQLETRVYAVADLVIPMPGFSPKTLEQVQAVAEGLERTQVKVDYKALLELITTTIEPNSWDTNGGRGTIRPFDKIMSLVIRQTQVNHEQIQKLLVRMRTFQDLQVSFHIERITLTKAEFEQWLDKAKGPGVEKLKAGTGGAATPLSDVAVMWLRNFSSAGVQSGPKMTLFNGQQAEIPLDMVDRKTASCISSLQLLPIVTPTFDQLHINVIVGQSADSTTQRMELVSVPSGQSLLIDLLEQSWLKKTVGVPVLDKIPHVDRVFKNAAAEVPEGDRQFYLLTPKVMLIPEVEVQNK